MGLRLKLFFLLLVLGFCASNPVGLLKIEADSETVFEIVKERDKQRVVGDIGLDLITYLRPVLILPFLMVSEQVPFSPSHLDNKIQYLYFSAYLRGPPLIPC